MVKNEVECARFERLINPPVERVHVDGTHEFVVQIVVVLGNRKKTSSGSGGTT